jgi:hypothetical protein
MQRDLVGEIPDHRAGPRIAKRHATVLKRDALDAAREVGLPVLAFGFRTLAIG